jgi:hypothetical protein
VRDVIYPAVGEKTLEEFIQEVEAAEKHERQLKLVTRASYSHHYRGIMPALLEVLSFRRNNDLHRPVMDALALLGNIVIANHRHSRPARPFRWTESLRRRYLIKNGAAHSATLLPNG